MPEWSSRPASRDVPKPGVSARNSCGTWNWYAGRNSGFGPGLGLARARGPPGVTGSREPMTGRQATLWSAPQLWLALASPAARPRDRPGSPAVTGRPRQVFLSRSGRYHLGNPAITRRAICLHPPAVERLVLCPCRRWLKRDPQGIGGSRPGPGRLRFLSVGHQARSAAASGARSGPSRT